MLTELEDLDDLPPDDLPFADLVRWIAGRLGRWPTLLEIAEVRFLLVEAGKRRRARAQQMWKKGSARRVVAEGEDAHAIVREILTSPEWVIIQSLLSEVAFLLIMRAPRVLGALQEYNTRPETIGSVVERADGLPPVRSVSRDTPFRVGRTLRKYMDAKLTGGLEVPMGCHGLPPSLLAAINASSVETVRDWRNRLDACLRNMADTVVRRLLEDLTGVGDKVRQDWRGIAYPMPGPPLSLSCRPSEGDSSNEPTEANDLDEETPSRPSAPSGSSSRL